MTSRYQTTCILHNALLTIVSHSYSSCSQGGALLEGRLSTSGRWKDMPKAFSLTCYRCHATIVL